MPARRAAPSFQLTRLAPSGRSVLVGVALFALAVGGYIAARETSMFAVRTIEIRGGDKTLQAQVRAALAGEMGQSLLKIDGNGLGRRIAPLPGVRAFRYDRAFPNTLRLAVEKHLNHDASCGNKQWFSPLTAVDHAEMGTTDQNEFSGPALCTKWSDPNKRSSFFGTFSY